MSRVVTLAFALALPAVAGCGSRSTAPTVPQEEYERQMKERRDNQEEMRKRFEGPSGSTAR